MARRRKKRKRNMRFNSPNMGPETKPESFTIGCDPELMLVKNGRLVSAIPIIKGTKERPDKLECGGIVSHDNVMIEYGTRPAKTEEEFVEANRSVLKEISAKFLPKDVRMVVRASANFPKEELNCEESRVFGCDPDFDAYEFSVNEMPEDAPYTPFRTCGGHIHIGNDKVKDDIDLLLDVAKGFDAFLAIPSMLFSKDPTSSKRRELYGKASAHRPKPYGIEYRAIDNFWVSSPLLTSLIYKLSRDGLNAIVKGHLSGINEDTLRNTVNESDLKQSEEILQSFVLPLCLPDTRDYFERALNEPFKDLYEAWEI